VTKNKNNLNKHIKLNIKNTWLITIPRRTRM